MAAVANQRSEIMKDSRDIAVPGADTFALARYEHAIEQFQSYVGDPIATIDEALKAAPAFMAGHVAKALMLFTLGERKFASMARESLDAARPHEDALVTCRRRR